MDWKPNPEVLNKNKIIKEPNGFTLIELMVVIIIVGILAAVAIPKFLDASHKAKASEFPTQLSAIYTGENAYSAERGSYITDLGKLRDSAGVEVALSSRWFNYTVTYADAASFTAKATVIASFGVATSGDYGTVTQANTKSCTADLQKYCPSWK